MLTASSTASRSTTTISSLLQTAVTARTAFKTGLFAPQVQSRAFTSKRPGPSLLYSRQPSRDSSSSLLRSVPGSHRSLFSTSRAAMAEASMQQASASSSSLASGSCVPCRKGAPRLEEHEIKEQVEQLNRGIEGEGWKIQEVSPGEKAILRSYIFKNFRTALAFTNSIGKIAEEEKHHPRLITEWGRVEVGWWTHAIGGLHQNDFIMAAKTEELARQAEGRK